MGVDSTQPTSRRGYLSQSELEQMANITITDTTEADDQISQAEELIDAFVGPQEKHIEEPIRGFAASATTNTLTVETSLQNTYDVDYLKLLEIEIIGGTGVGQRRKITGNTHAGVITVDSNWDTTPDSTSYFKITQIGKFPRVCDVESAVASGVTYFYKVIPETIKRAVAAQVGYIVEMGESFFAGDRSEKESESIGDYSYSKGQGVANLYRLISPKAKLLLKGIINRTGTIEP